LRFLADECVYHITVRLLRERGHDVVTVQEAGLSGKADPIVLAHAVSERRVFITNDMHFSNLLLFPPQQHFGIIVLKIRPATLNYVHTVLLGYLSKVDQVKIEHTLIIIDRNKYRIHR
jgi:predicted nuclease of predicted toxin-antitoxin system